MSTLTQDLSLLEARGLLRVTVEGDTALVRFKHALTREATYNSILQARRSELHRASAETLAGLYPHPDLDMVVTIADHWQHGGADARALETLLPHALALVYTGRGSTLMLLLSSLDRGKLNAAQERELDLALGNAHAARGEYETALALYERALPRTETALARAAVLRSMGTAYDHLGNYPRAIEHHQAALTLAEQVGDVREQAHAAGGLGMAHASLGNLDQAEQFLLTSRALSTRLGEGLELANAEYNLAVLLFDRGKYREAIQSAERARALDEKSGHAMLGARSDQLLGACYHGLRDLPRAERYYQRALAVARDVGDRLGVALTLGNLAELYADENQLAAAEAAYTETLRSLRALKHEYLLAFNLSGLAQVYLRQAQTAELPEERERLIAQAAAAADQALEIADKIQSPERQGVAHRVRAEIALARGDAALADREARQALQRLEGVSAPLELERVRKLLGSERT